jgi:hypothetical protein
MEMKIKFVFILLAAGSLFFSCLTKKKPTNVATPIPDQTLTVDFYTSWGGSAEAILERKNGKDNLYSTYHEKVQGVDTVLTTINFISASTADSIYSFAEKVNWNADANHGTAETRVGLKFYMSLKKGRNEKSVSWENLKSANELPDDIRSVIKIVNRISPDDFKIY